MCMCVYGCVCVCANVMPTKGFCGIFVSMKGFVIYCIYFIYKTTTNLVMYRSFNGRLFYLMTVGGRTGYVSMGTNPVHNPNAWRKDSRESDKVMLV